MHGTLRPQATVHPEYFTGNMFHFCSDSRSRLAQHNRLPVAQGSGAGRRSRTIGANQKCVKLNPGRRPQCLRLPLSRPQSVTREIPFCLFFCSSSKDHTDCLYFDLLMHRVLAKNAICQLLKLQLTGLSCYGYIWVTYLCVFVKRTQMDAYKTVNFRFYCLFQNEITCMDEFIIK